MKKHRFGSFVCALAMLSGSLLFPCKTASAAASDNIDIVIYPDKNISYISPYIYGINEDKYNSDVSVNSIFQVGEKYTAYNWENNYSNSGDAWYQNSGADLVNSFNYSEWSTPGLIALELSKKASYNNIAFKAIQLPLAGYVAADKNGPVNTDSLAPSERWKEVIYNKQTEISSVPDLEDNRVYIDEYINYLVSLLGSSASPTGIQGYCMDINPSEWDENFSLIHKYPVTPSELVRKTVNLASAVKKIDSKAITIGPNLKDFSAMINLNNQWDWSNECGQYSYFIDYYLDLMKQYERSSGVKLLDVFGVQYYSKATAGEAETVTDQTGHYNYELSLARMQSTRSLWDPTYVEKGETGDNYLEFLPYIPMINASINTYNSGTKLGFIRYNFGGGSDISGGIAQADALGIFATYGVYLAGLDPQTSYCPFQKSAINLYTDYDGNGSSFGNYLIQSQTSDVEKSSVYASYDNLTDGTIKVILINKSDTAQNANIKIDTSITDYKNTAAYGFNQYNSNIVQQKGVDNITNNSFCYELKPFSVVELILETNNSPFIGNNKINNLPEGNEIVKETDASGIQKEEQSDINDSDINDKDVIINKDINIIHNNNRNIFAYIYLLVVLIVAALIVFLFYKKTKQK